MLIEIEFLSDLRMSLARSRTPIRGAPSPAPSRRARESPAPEGREEESSFWEKIGTLGRKKKVTYNIMISLNIYSLVILF